MEDDRTGAIAVIFVSRRNDIDAKGYAIASAAMADLAAQQPGYLGMDAVRDHAGAGISISCWRDIAAAQRWHDNAEHRAIREQGRAMWCDSYAVHIARVERGYRWSA